MFTLENQIKAVNIAIRESNREMVKAKESGDEEWISDTQFLIDGLESAKESLKSLQSLRLVIQ
jgi:hypothetical protein